MRLLPSTLFSLRAVRWYRIDIASLRLDYSRVDRRKNLPVAGTLVDGEIAVLRDIECIKSPTTATFASSAVPGKLSTRMYLKP